jgi:hypothetical protein
VWCPKTLQHGLPQSINLRSLRDIQREGQHLRTCRLHLGSSPVQRILLHIGQHQVHAQLGTQAGALQAKAGTCAGQNGCFTFEICDHIY